MLPHVEHRVARIMDASKPRPRAKEHLSFPASPMTDVLVQIPTIHPGMDLPFELWDNIISFLELEVYPLLACCLTCHNFRKHARDRLIRLFYLYLPLGNYTNLDRLVEEIRTTPGKARSIRGLTLGGRPPFIFSLILHRLAAQLINLDRLDLIHITEAPHVPSSTWSLYGRAFPSVAYLTLETVQFPSLMDFVRFITSFPALQHLRLTSISCAYPEAPQRILRLPRTLNPLKHLTLWDEGGNGDHFSDLFIHWFSLRGNVVESLSIDCATLSYPSSFSLLHSIHTHLQVRYIDLQDQLPRDRPPNRRSWQRFISGCFAVYPVSSLNSPRTDVISRGCPALHTIRVYRMRNQYIPFVRALISHTLKPALAIEIYPYIDESPTSDAWHLFDSILFALHCRSQGGSVVLPPLFNNPLTAHFPMMSIVNP